MLNISQKFSTWARFSQGCFLPSTRTWKSLKLNSSEFLLLLEAVNKEEDWKKKRKLRRSFAYKNNPLTSIGIHKTHSTETIFKISHSCFQLFGACQSAWTLCAFSSWSSFLSLFYRFLAYANLTILIHAILHLKTFFLSFTLMPFLAYIHCITRQDH